MATKNKPSKHAVEDLRKFAEEKGMDIQQEISLCLSDLTKSKMTKGSNGKIYCNIVVAMRKEPDQWHRDLKVYEPLTKEERENHVAKNYVGGGKTIIFVTQTGEEPTDEDLANILPEEKKDEKDDLPY